MIYKECFIIAIIVTLTSFTVIQGSKNSLEDSVQITRPDMKILGSVAGLSEFHKKFNNARLHGNFQRKIKIAKIQKMMKILEEEPTIADKPYLHEALYKFMRFG